MNINNLKSNCTIPLVIVYSTICDHLRMQGMQSGNPLLHVMYDKKASSSLSSARMDTDVLAASRSRSDMQVQLLEQLRNEDYAQVRKRAAELEARLSSVDQRIETVHKEVASVMQLDNRSATRNTYRHTREIAPALSTFNWSSSGTTNAELYQWHNMSATSQGSRVKYTTQWGPMSKYGDDPCVIMMAMKNKENFEATKKLKKTK